MTKFYKLTGMKSKYKLELFFYLLGIKKITKLHLVMLQGE